MKDDLLKKFKRTKYLKLIFAIMIDMAGNASYLFPALGSVTDIIWAPISGALIFILFPNRKLVALGGFLEEIIPFADIIPSACIAWTKDYVKYNKETLSEFVRKRVDDEKLVEELLKIHTIDSIDSNE